MNTKDKIISRRNVMGYFLFGSFATWLGASLYPIARFLTPSAKKLSEIPASVTVTESAENIKKNSSIIVPYGDEPAIVIKTAEGRLRAFMATCTHLNCTVQYDPASKRIICPCHDGIFNLRGKNIAGPPPRPLQELNLKARNELGVIVLSLPKDKA